VSGALQSHGIVPWYALNKVSVGPTRKDSLELSHASLHIQARSVVTTLSPLSWLSALCVTALEFRILAANTQTQYLPFTNFISFEMWVCFRLNFTLKPVQLAIFVNLPPDTDGLTAG